MRVWWLMCIAIMIARDLTRCCTLIGKNDGKISMLSLDGCMVNLCIRVIKQAD